MQEQKRTMVTTDLIEPGNLIREISQAIRTWQPNGRLLQRFEYEIAPTDPLTWLAHVKKTQKIYWSDRKRETEIAGIGNALTFQGWSMADLDAGMAEMETLLRQKERLKFFGGIRFSRKNANDPTWQAFPYFYFNLPQFELIRKDDRYIFVCNLFRKPGQKAEDAKSDYLHFVQRLFQDNRKAKPRIRFIERQDNPNHGKWLQSVRQAVNCLDGKPLEKVVLARKTELTFSHPFSPESLLRNLRASNPNSFLFLFQLNGQNAFLGSTPERLYKRKGRRLETEAIAGTRRRGQTPEEDRQLKHDLLHCEKDLREHNYVVRSIENVLTRHSHSVQKDDRVGILENARVQHLLLRFQAELKEDVNDMEVLHDLHPTPAVGGFPKEQAIDKIHELERFDRGWYAGPVGWIGSNEAEFAVGIRSALLQGNTVHLFAGAGIVRGSDPESEWRELENKIANFIKILHIA